MTINYLRRSVLKAEEVAWAAGIIEVEGSIVYHKINGRPNSYRVMICAVMSDKDVIERLHKILAVGSLTSVKPSKIGTKPMYSWAVQNQKGCFDTLIKIMPHLGERRLAKAQEMFSFLEEKVVEKYTS